MLESKPNTSIATDEAEELNVALTAYVQTIPQHERLEEHLRKLRRLERKAVVQASLEAAVKCTEDYLYAQLGGITWSKNFEAGLFKQLVQSSPWLSEAGFRSLVTFGKWFCWHEGLNASQPDA